MPIFQHNGKLHAFVHVPKCGGTTVEDALKDRFGPLGFFETGYYARTEPYRWSKTSPQHIAWADFTKLIPDTMIETVFAIVRHPFKRFASAYNHGARSGAVPKGMGPEEWFDKTVGALDLLPYRADNHLRPISDLVPERAVTFRLEDGLAPVINWIDTTFNTSSENALRDGNVAPKPSTDGFEVRPMSGPLKKRLQRLYAPDFERFGYDADASKGVMLHHPKPQSGNLAQLLRAKLLARRFEYRLRLLESRAMTAATNVQKPKRPAETRPGPSVEG